MSPILMRDWHACIPDCDSHHGAKELIYISGCYPSYTTPAFELNMITDEGTPWVIVCQLLCLLQTED